MLVLWVVAIGIFVCHHCESEKCMPRYYILMLNKMADGRSLKGVTSSIPRCKLTQNLPWLVLKGHTKFQHDW